MSSGGKVGAPARSRARAVIPRSVKKTIDAIKEITGHELGEDEIYAMLKECSMDPNETAQKLLLLDAFREVKKRRDRRRENANKEPAQSRQKQGSEAQLNLAGSWNYSAKPLSHDAGGRRNSSTVKENVISHASGKDVGNATLANAQKNEASSVPSQITDISNCPPGITSQSNRCEVGSDQNLVEQNADSSSERNIVTILPHKMSNNVLGVGNNHHLETMHTVTSRPSSARSIRSEVIVPQKEEWKPKCTNPSIGQNGSQPKSPQTPSSNAMPQLGRKFEEFHISNTQQVIIPNHIQVPEAGKLGFCFGSFDGSFELEGIQDGSLRSDKSTPLSESSETITESVKVLQLSNQTVSIAGTNNEIQYPDQTGSHSQGPEDLSSIGVEFVSSVTHDHGGSKLEGASQGLQNHVHTSSIYNDGYVQPVANGHLTPSENSEPRALGTPQIPAFVMQQLFDPTSYYAQFYRPVIDSSGRILPLNSGEAANKYNGDAGLISAQTSQSPQEGNAPLFESSPILSQAAGFMQSSISPNQQHIPVFRQPTGIHLPHYPPFVPYAPYFSPFYVPPHAIHQFFSSGALPQQPHGGNLYPNPNGTTANYLISENKQGSNTPSSTHVEALISTANEGVKESSNMYTSNEQTEGSVVYRGQLAFAPAQPSQVNYTGVFHPAHPLLQQSQPISIPIDMMLPTASVYPQQQHAQLNWPSN